MQCIKDQLHARGNLKWEHYLHVWAHDNYHVWCFWNKDIVGLQKDYKSLFKDNDMRKTSEKVTKFSYTRKNTHKQLNSQKEEKMLPTTKSLCMLSRIGCLPASIATGPLSISKATWSGMCLISPLKGNRYMLKNIKLLTCKFWSSISVNRLSWYCMSKWVDNHI